MRCISRSITLLVSAGLALAGECVVVDGARVLAGALAGSVPAFGALAAETDLGPAPVGAMARIYTKSQLAAFFAGGEPDGLPDRLCVRRWRAAIGREDWQGAIEAALRRQCGEQEWRAKVIDWPRHEYPRGELGFGAGGFVRTARPPQMWRGVLAMADKSTIPVWVRLEVEVRKTIRVTTRAVRAGEMLSEADSVEEERWVPGVCGGGGEKQEWRGAGMVARRAIAAGVRVGMEDLRRPPAVIRGQSVEVEAEAGTARIRIPAVAEGNAEVGDVVRLKSSWNGSRLVGRVTGNQKARVE
jgi:flagella basal body P-ring formation protein FlgA